MTKQAHKIVVAGDISIDWLAVATEALDAGPSTGGAPLLNWQLRAGTRMVARPGGALLLARMVKAATGAKLLTCQLDELEKIPPEQHIHSIVELAPFGCTSSPKDDKNKVYRVQQFRGFAGPATGVPRQLPVVNDDARAGMVILDDASNGFRDTVAVWPAALGAEGAHPIVLYKMSRPIAVGKLWDAVRKSHAERMVVVVSADDLRASGVQISRRLSWERTATDFVWQMASNPALLVLANSTHLVVRFGIDGAIHYRRGEGRTESRLYYDPAVVEGGFGDRCPGDMLGFNSAFVASLAARIVEKGLEGVGEGIRDGLLAGRRLFCEGFGRDVRSLDYPVEKIFGAGQAGEPPLAEVAIPNPTQTTADPAFWCILKSLDGVSLEEAAYEIVVRGEAKALQPVPAGQFGDLKTVDRAEIESYRSIRNLMIEYLGTPKPKHPLSIAVFGPPGSGKSFGVTEVAKSVAPGQIKKIDFNVSQFGSPSDLIKALHLVHDAVLGDKVPLVFFDEFDCSSEREHLGWLKYFLMPMQDGIFRDGEALHPIGKAIFVFAGGTSNTYAEFCTDRPVERVTHSEAWSTPSPFRDAKGPDFLSRLRGYVDILGVNGAAEDDRLYMVGRAVKLRSMFERKAKHIFDSTGRCRIDEGVLRAMIKTPVYKHGVRSMEAIIEMSMLAGRRSFEQAALPPFEQLKLHVDAEMFSRLVVRDVILGSAREIIAKAIHEKYCADQAENKPADDPAMQPWEQLAEDLKESNLQQADHIPTKLRRIGCGYVPVTGREPNVIEFSAAEIEKMAEMEHERWVAERRLAGWTLGPRDPDRKMSPYLVPWADLPDDVKGWDRKAVQGIPALLASVGFEVYRMR